MNPTKSKRKEIKSIDINKKWCKGCGICVDICPKNVLIMDGLTSKVEHLEDCIVCGMCEMACPDFCIEVIPQNNDE